jgi:hypothetical protein
VKCDTVDKFAGVCGEYLEVETIVPMRYKMPYVEASNLDYASVVWIVGIRGRGGKENQEEILARIFEVREIHPGQLWKERRFGG